MNFKQLKIRLVFRSLSKTTSCGCNQMVSLSLYSSKNQLSSGWNWILFSKTLLFFSFWQYILYSFLNVLRFIRWTINFTSLFSSSPVSSPLLRFIKLVHSSPFSNQSVVFFLLPTALHFKGLWSMAILVISCSTFNRVNFQYTPN